MSWDKVLENWTSVLESLCQDFPYLDADAVRRFRGDQSKLVEYLADTHHLTPQEARHALVDWMTFTAPRFRTDAAA